MSPKLKTIVVIGLLCLWSLAFIPTVYCLTPVHIDTFQNAGAYAGHLGGEIGWPMMENWRGYNSDWGFHWFGPQAIRSMIGLIIPFDPIFDISMLALVWAFVSYHVTRWTCIQHSQFFMPLIIVIGMITNSSLMISVGFYRPEVYVSLASLPLLVKKFNCRNFDSILISLSLFILPLLHPVGIVIGFAYMVSLLQVRFANRKDPEDMIADSKLILFCIPYILGIISFVSYYYLNSVAGDQLLDNISVQRQLPMSFINIFSIGFRGLRGSIDGCFHLVGFICAIYIQIIVFRNKFLRKNTELPYYAITCSCIVCAIWGYAIFAKVLNPCHIIPSLIFNCGVILWVLNYVRIHYSKFAYHVIAISVAGICALQPVFLLWRVNTLFIHDFTSFRDQHKAIISNLPRDASLFLPVSLWEAAYLERCYDRCYLSTFPNLGFLHNRIEYEKYISQKVQPGDYLLLDVDDQVRGVFADVESIRMRVSGPYFLDDKLWAHVKDIEIGISGSEVLKRKYMLFRRNSVNN